MRTIGIRHRVKKTQDGEAHPTQLCIIGESGVTKTYDLDTEDHELDFLLGRFPISWKILPEGEKPSENVLPHHQLVWGKSFKVPSVYDGLISGDRVAMTLGGSGDYFAFALSLHGEKIGAEVLRIPPAVLKDRRGEADKSGDASLLANLLQNEPGIFLSTTPKDRDLIRLQRAYRDLETIRKDRVACEQRIHSRAIGQIFCAEDLYSAGTLEVEIKKLQASDATLALLKKEETRVAKLVEVTLESFPVWTEVLSQVDGCGVKIAARIIAGIGDVRRFRNKAKFKAFSGVHLVQVGESKEFGLARRRAGVQANWSDLVRQGFYLLVDQFVKNEDSEWGQRFRAIKVEFLRRHPEPMDVPGKKGKSYSKGHIHRMAIWRTATKFAEWLYREWSRLEKQAEVEV